MINKAEQTIEKRAVRNIRHLEREINAMKSRQLRGGENIVVDASEELTDAASIAPGNFYVFTFSVLPERPQLTLAALSLSLYINNDNDPDYLWPDGPSVTTDMQASTFVAWFQDLATSNDSTGLKVYKVLVQNFSNANTYDYHVHAKFYYPKTNQNIL